MLDYVKRNQDEREEEKEALRKGDILPDDEEEVPPAEEDEFEECPPMEEIPKEVLGRYQKVGECKFCDASIYVEEYSASSVVRPRLIYTCAEWCLAGYDERDVRWSPKFHPVGDINFGAGK